jgi:hypothetical protein
LIYWAEKTGEIVPDEPVVVHTVADSKNTEQTAAQKEGSEQAAD